MCYSGYKLVKITTITNSKYVKWHDISYKYIPIVNKGNNKITELRAIL